MLLFEFAVIFLLEFFKFLLCLKLVYTIEVLRQRFAVKKQLLMQVAHAIEEVMWMHLHRGNNYVLNFE